MSKPSKDKKIETILEALNEALVDLDTEYTKEYVAPRYPIIFVIGTQRSGTTIMTQILGSLYKISYPSNLIARFWRAPYLGSVLAKSLGLDQGNAGFSSTQGATAEVEGPHEFSYFWRYWFPGSAQNAIEYQLSPDQRSSFLRQLAAWQEVNAQPLLFKNLLEVIPNISQLSRILSTSYFIHIDRDDVFTIQSTYESRMSYHKNYTKWFGVKPSNFKQVQSQSDPLKQVVEQVFYVKQNIEASLSSVKKERVIKIKYEDLVTKPDVVIKAIENNIGIEPWRRSEVKVSEVQIRAGNTIRLGKDDLDRIVSHLEKLRKDLHEI